MLVVVGVCMDGKRRLLALEETERESKGSWLCVLSDLRERGMRSPVLAIGDGNLGFWAALSEVYGSTVHQRCWEHFLRSVLSRLPKKLHESARAGLRRMMAASDRKASEAERARFEKEFNQYPQAVEILVKDWELLVRYYDFPREHFKYLRTTHIIESPLAALRRSFGLSHGSAGNRRETLWRVYQLLVHAEQHTRRIDCAIKLLWVQKGVRFQDGKPECNLEILELRQRLTPSSTHAAPVMEATGQATPDGEPQTPPLRNI